MPTTAPTPAATTAPAVTGPVTIRWQDFPDYQPFWDRLKAQLAKDVPNLTVEYEPMNYDGWVEKLLTTMAAGTPPDVFCSWDPESAKFAEKGTVLDLQPLVERDFSQDLLNDFYKWQWAGFLSHDKATRYGLPHYVNLAVVYYNKAAFDEVALSYPTRNWTYDDYAQALVKLTKKDSSGKITRWGGQLSGRWLYHVQAYGGHMVNPDDWTECWLDRKEAQDALEWIRKGTWDQNSLAQPVQLKGIGQASGVNLPGWGQGMLGSSEDGLGNLAYYVNEAKFDWDMIDVPVGPARRATMGTTDGHMIAKATKQQEAAWKFLVWTTDNFFQGILMEAWGGIPVRNSQLETWKATVTKSYPYLAKVNLDLVPNAMKEGYPMLDEYFKKAAESDAAIKAAFQKIFEVGDTPVSYLKDIAAQVTALNRAG